MQAYHPAPQSAAACLQLGHYLGPTPKQQLGDSPRDSSPGFICLLLQDETVVDDSKNTVVAHWHATAAHLLPTARSGPATGAVSEISGMDKFHFSDTGRITSIMSFRERFADEEPQQQQGRPRSDGMW
jgi:hypothetical protein